MERPDIFKDILPVSCWSHDTLKPEGILIHAISARNTNHDNPYDYSSVRKIFVDYGVSAHFGVLRNGSIIQWVPEENVAYHAGKSRFRHLQGLNSYWIGIEFFGVDDSAFDDRQYGPGAELTSYLMEKYKIPSEYVRMHSEVSNHEVRSDPKWDPGKYFDWIRFGGLIID